MATYVADPHMAVFTVVAAILGSDEHRFANEIEAVDPRIRNVTGSDRSSWGRFCKLRSDPRGARSVSFRANSR